MFRFFKKKSPPPAAPVQPDAAPAADEPRLADEPAPQQTPVEPAPAAHSLPVASANEATRDPAPEPIGHAGDAPSPASASSERSHSEPAPASSERSHSEPAPTSSERPHSEPAPAATAGRSSMAGALAASSVTTRPASAPQTSSPATSASTPANAPASAPSTPSVAAAPVATTSPQSPAAAPSRAPAPPVAPTPPQAPAATPSRAAAPTPSALPTATAPAQTPASSPAASAPVQAPAAIPPLAPAPAPSAQPAPPAVETPEPPAKKTSWLGRLKQGLARTGQSLGGLFVGVKVDENLFEELESALIMADAGLEATEKLLTALRTRVRKERIEDPAKVKTALRELLADHLRPLERTFDLQKAKPLVVMIAGVNGAGKTTSIGKLAHTFQRQGASVLLAAGDTFRAAAREQLIEWGSRNNVSVIAQEGGDPAAVAFDAINAGRARGTGVVMVDTAGRLPTQLNLMEELKKIRRVIGKADSTAPHEVLLVVDGNTGQNVLAQIRAFDAAINLTGLVVTKLDGTAKGGTLAAVAAGSNGVRPIPVYWIGVGEGMEDLQPFVADEFAGALLAD